MRKMQMQWNMKAVLSVLAATLMLSWPAIYNGYPFIFPDTHGYLLPVIQFLETRWLSPAWSRPPFYGIAALPIHMNWSLWPMVFIQALIMSHLLYITMRVVLGHFHHRVYLGVILILAAFSSLPWHVTTLIPDIFAPALLLGFFLLALPGDALKTWEWLYITILTTAAAAFHFAHVALAAFLALVALGIWLFKKTSETLTFRRTLIIIIPFVIAVTSLSLMNLVTRDTSGVAPHGSLFLLNKYKNRVKAYLHENCDKRDYHLCKYLDELDSVLWGSDSLTAKIGANKLNNEAKELVQRAFWWDPPAMFNDALESTLQQFVTFWTGGWIYPHSNVQTGSGTYNLLAYFDREYQDYLTSRQSTNDLPFSIIRLLHTIAVLIAIPFFVFSMLRSYADSDKVLNYLFVFVVSGLVANAAICATLSGVVERYQSRVIWLVVFVAIIGSYRLFVRRSSTLTVSAASA